MTLEKDKEDKSGYKVYEAGYLVSLAVPEDKIAEEAASIRAVIEKSGAYIISEELPRLRQLAYVLERSEGGKKEKHSNAYFGNIKFEVASDSAAEIKKHLDADKNIIRFVLLKVPKEIPVAHKPFFRSKPEKPKMEDKEAPTSKITMTEAELDKTIEELVVK